MVQYTEIKLDPRYERYGVVELTENPQGTAIKMLVVTQAGKAIVNLCKEDAAASLR